MVQHADVARNNIHEPKDVENANAGEAYIADGLGSGSWGLQANPATINSRIVINSLADFQAAATNDFAVDQYYQLPDYTEFWISSPEDAPILMNYGLRLGVNTVLNGPSPNLATLVANYADFGNNILNSMVQAIGVNMFINSVKLAGGGSQAYARGVYTEANFAGTGRLLVVDNFVVEDFLYGGDIDVGPQGLFSGEGTTVLSCVTGMRFRDDQKLPFGSGTINFSQGLWSNCAITCIDMTDLAAGSGSPGFLMGRVIAIVPDGGSVITTDPSGAAFLPGALGEVLNCRIIYGGTGTGTFWADPVSYDQNDIRWTVSGNTGLDDSITAGRLSSVLVSSPQNIPLSTGVPIEVIPVNTVLQNGELKRFTSPSNGRIEYIDERKIFCNITASLVGQATSGSNDYTLCLYKNFGEVNEELIACIQDVEFDSSKDIPYTINGIANLEQNDFLSLAV